LLPRQRIERKRIAAIQRAADHSRRRWCESIPVRANLTPKMVNARLTERVALLRFDETLQQSLSGKSCGLIIAADWGFFDAVSHCFNSLRQKSIAPISPQPPGFGRG
jgi:hypothetical protein